jgi:dynein heavy chain
LRIVTQSLEDLDKGIKGLVVISSELELLNEALYAARVPQLWQSMYPSLKPLGPWVRDLGRRLAQLRRWALDAPPKVFWLPGFTFPTGFLTALLQTSSRKNGVPIDALSWDFVVMNSNESSITMQPKEGGYVNGLFLEGARWDADAGCLAEPLAMELYCAMPIIHFKPVENRKRSKGLYNCPMYLYPIRTGTRERPSFMVDVDLRSGPRDDTFWIKRGTALLLALDY